MHYIPPGAEASQVGLQRVRNAICVGQCLSLNLFKATNYTMQGCESVGGALGQSHCAELGNKDFSLFHLLDPACFWCIFGHFLFYLQFKNLAVV